MINTKSMKKKKLIIVTGGYEFVEANLFDHLWTKKSNVINLDRISDISNLRYKKRQKSSFFDYSKQKYF
tara:strand:+ start:13228 stop:13434 length:207 start_codon:yes stop_codon:yes gene_type:complete